MTSNGKALVVIGHDDVARRLLRLAGERAVGCDIDLVLLTVMPDEEYEDRYRARAGIPHLDMPYTVEAAEEEGHRHARRLARDVFSGLDVDYVIESRVGRKASIVLDAAEAFECNEIFIAGTASGPWHDTVFDRVFEEVVREFGGPVTVLMDPERR